MKQKHYLSSVLLALCLGSATAQADNVSPYAVDFNTAVSTSAHDFKAAPGWGHVVAS